MFTIDFIIKNNQFKQFYNFVKYQKIILVDKIQRIRIDYLKNFYRIFFYFEKNVSINID